MVLTKLLGHSFLCAAVVIASAAKQSNATFLRVTVARLLRCARNDGAVVHILYAEYTFPFIVLRRPCANVSVIYFSVKAPYPGLNV